MEKAILQVSHEDLFLDTGYLLALGFYEGWACFRIAGKEPANLSPWSLGAVAAGGNLASADQIKSGNNYYLSSWDETQIYHFFWGVTPTPARITWEYPPKAPIGSLLSTDRSISDDVGYVDGHKSPYSGPFSAFTEIFTVFMMYPQFQAYNPTNDNMYNVMLNFDVRKYMYQFIMNGPLIKEMLVGNRRCKRYVMGPIKAPAKMPQWLSNALTRKDNYIQEPGGKAVSVLQYSLDVMAGIV